MNTSIRNELEVALIPANTEQIDGWNLNWLISKSQVEYILHDIASIPSVRNDSQLQRAQYQDEALPVFNLEKHFGLQENPDAPNLKYVVVKVPLHSGGISKAVIRLTNSIRIRKLTFNSTLAQATGLQKNEDDILGAFTLSDNQLVIVPDIAAMLLKEL
ncbi:chemotaxis protein CheW [Desulfosediminicola flagellatus]|uniref:chemotaxis protein CheW n=1 Tax=Desulfosediminicola flagellatus TaxID=2569541 RepID=UPI0010AC9519|nr:chemotaxis protein CheW [Desulfosediminicola flagellatus]